MICCKREGKNKKQASQVLRIFLKCPQSWCLLEHFLRLNKECGEWTSKLLIFRALHWLKMVKQDVGKFFNSFRGCWFVHSPLFGLEHKLSDFSNCILEFCSVLLLLFNCQVVSNSSQPHGLQHTRPPSLPPSPGVFPSSCPLHRWCYPTISSSVELFSFCLQSFPASGSLAMSWFFASGGPSIGASASASVLPMSIQGWFPLGVTGLIYVSICVKDTISSGTFQNSIPSLVQPWQLDFFLNWIQEY